MELSVNLFISFVIYFIPLIIIVLNNGMESPSIPSFKLLNNGIIYFYFSLHSILNHFITNHFVVDWIVGRGKWITNWS